MIRCFACLVAFALVLPLPVSAEPQAEPEAAAPEAVEPEARPAPGRRGPGPRGMRRFARKPWFERDDVVEKAGIDDALRAEIRAIVAEHAERHTAILEEQRGGTSTRATLHALLDAPELDEAAVREQMDALAKGASALALNRYELRLAVRKRLSAEQLQRLIEIEPHWSKGPWIPRPERGMRRRGGPPPGGAEG